MDYINFTNPGSSETSDLISSLYSAYASLKHFSSYTDLMIQSFYDLYDKSNLYPICQVNTMFSIDIFVLTKSLFANSWIESNSISQFKLKNKTKNS